jgi:hybrid cluster-associated redox disulfide protein
MAKVTKDMIIADIIRLDQGTIPILLEAGMHCIGCPSAQGESLEEATMVHGISSDELVNQLNTYLESI